MIKSTLWHSRFKPRWLLIMFIITFGVGTISVLFFLTSHFNKIRIFGQVGDTDPWAKGLLDEVQSNNGAHEIFALRELASIHPGEHDGGWQNILFIRIR